MKNFYSLILLCVLFACKKDDIEQDGSNIRLQKIMANGKIDQTFEYDKGLLVKENNFGFCEQNPSDEYFYTYQNSQLKRLNITTRSLYSSISAICNPDMGMRFEERIEYDNNQRISKIIRGNSYMEYHYNSEGYVNKLILYGGTNPLTTTFTYDAKGNLISETGYDGRIIQYEYDDKINPFYLMNQRPTWISPFNKSPNNVIKSTSSSGGFTREIQYNAQGLPSQVKEDNKLIYVFVYE